LENLGGLEGVTSFLGISIWNNNVLTDFCAIEDFVVLYADVIWEILELGNNGYNPTIDDFLNGDCSL